MNKLILLLLAAANSLSAFAQQPQSCYGPRCPDGYAWNHCTNQCVRQHKPDHLMLTEKISTESSPIILSDRYLNVSCHNRPNGMNEFFFYLTKSLPASDDAPLSLTWIDKTRMPFLDLSGEIRGFKEYSCNRLDNSKCIDFFIDYKNGQSFKVIFNEFYQLNIYSNGAIVRTYEDVVCWKNQSVGH